MDWHQSVAARQLKDVSDYMRGDCVLSSNWAAALMFSVKHQQQRSRRVQPARPSLCVGRGADAKTEAGGERLVHPGAATVQLPATVRLTDVELDTIVFDVYFCSTIDMYQEIFVRLSNMKSVLEFATVWSVIRCNGPRAVTHVWFYVCTFVYAPVWLRLIHRNGPVTVVKAD